MLTTLPGLCEVGPVGDQVCGHLYLPGLLQEHPHSSEHEYHFLPMVSSWHPVWRAQDVHTGLRHEPVGVGVRRARLNNKVFKQ